jgi:hypothetical protein
MTFSDEQIKRATDTNILAVAKMYYGDSVKKVGVDKYRIEGQGLGGLEINDIKNAWYNFSEAKGGVGGLNFLTNFFGMHFQTAMQEAGDPQSNRDGGITELKDNLRVKAYTIISSARRAYEKSSKTPIAICNPPQAGAACGLTSQILAEFHLM